MKVVVRRPSKNSRYAQLDELHKKELREEVEEEDVKQGFVDVPRISEDIYITSRKERDWQ